jgi:peroxiredoxin Q/BCP
MQPGDRLPDLALPGTGGREVPLRSLVGKPLVLYFYPRDATPGCTRQAQDFAALHGEFAAAGVQVVGVSRDTIGSHERFREKQALPFDLLSDRDEALCRAFDVLKEKTMYGRKVFGIERSTFLFDARGILVEAWRGVKVPGHAQAVLDTARAPA